MNCELTTDWLLTVKAAEPLPARLADHFAACPACRKLREQLVRTEALLRLWGDPENNPRARARLEARLDQMPREAVPLPPQPARPRPLSLHRWVAALAAALLIGLGWLLGRYTGSPANHRNDKQAAPAMGDMTASRPNPDEPVVPIIVRVASLAPRLSSASDPSARLEVLLLLSDELRSEGLRLASRGSCDDVARLVRLHERVLREGIVAQAARLPDGKDKDAQITRLFEKLRQAEVELSERERSVLPSIAECIKPLALAVRDASRNLSAGKPLDIAPATEPANPPPLEGLVGLTLRLAREETPLPRAEASAELAQLLAKATVLLSVSGQTEYSMRMGNYLDQVMSYGVADNLDLIEVEDRTGAQKQAVAQVRERAGGVAEVLESNLAQSPPAAKKCLQQALDASRPGQERAARGGKGKGPRPDHGPKGKDHDHGPKGKDHGPKGKDNDHGPKGKDKMPPGGPKKPD